MSTFEQDQSFSTLMNTLTDVSRVALEKSTEWMRENLSPPDVFSIKQLEDWAESNGYSKD